MVTRARAPPHFSFQILSLLPAELPLFHGLSELRLLSKWSKMTAKCGNCHITVSMEDITEGRFDGHLLRDILSWMVHLNISKVFIGFLGTIHGYVSLREVSAFISADVADDI